MSIKPLLVVVSGYMDLSGQEGTGGYPALRCEEQCLGGDGYQVASVG